MGAKRKKSIARNVACTKGAGYHVFTLGGDKCSMCGVPRWEDAPKPIIAKSDNSPDLAEAIADVHAEEVDAIQGIWHGCRLAPRFVEYETLGPRLCDDCVGVVAAYRADFLAAIRSVLSAHGAESYKGKGEGR